MSTEITTPDGGANVGPPNRGRQTLWVTAGVVGLTGVVGLAVLGGIAARDDEKAGSAGQAAAPADAGPRVDAAGDTYNESEWSGSERSGQDDRRATEKHREKTVPCSSDKLIQAILHANQNRGGVLTLAKDCTYELTRSKQGNGLPVITEPIVLAGHNTTIARAATADHFRILNVGRDGHLTLRGVTVKNGRTVPPLPFPTPEAAPLLTLSAPTNTPQPAAPTAAESAATAAAVGPFVGGAGILVQRGGRADIEKSSIRWNQTGHNGGGIANYGTTTIGKSSVESNSAAAFGGGIFNVGVLRIEDSKIEQNDARQGGGGFANGSFRPGVKGGTVWVWKSTINHNHTQGLAGGILDRSGEMSVTRSQVTENTAGRDAGGVLGVDGSQLYLEQVMLERNVAMGVGGGLAVAADAIAVLQESALKQNVANGAGGGGLFNAQAFVTLRDSQVARNRAVGPFAVGGGIVNAFGQVDLVRSTVTQNAATTPPGGIFTTNDGVDIDRKSAVKQNRPTNCLGSPVVPERCFG